MISTFVSYSFRTNVKSEEEAGKKYHDTTVNIAGGVPKVEEYKTTYSITITPPKAPYPSKGYISNKDTSPAAQIIRLAGENQKPIICRFERKRLNEDAYNKPLEYFSDMSKAKGNILNVVTGVFDPKTNSWLPTSNALSDPADDEAGAMKFIKETLAQASPEDAERLAQAFFESTKPEPTVSGQRTTIRPSQFDFQRNLLSMYFFICDLEEKMTKEQGFQPEFNDKVKKLMSIKLLNIADELQKLILNSDNVDQRDYSHTTARYVMFNTIEKLYPISKDILNNEGFKQWCENVYNASADIIRWSQSISQV